jgi:hypothetical protein
MNLLCTQVEGYLVRREYSSRISKNMWPKIEHFPNQTQARADENGRWDRIQEGRRWHWQHRFGGPFGHLGMAPPPRIYSFRDDQ